MNSSYTNKNFSNSKVETFDWLIVQTEMKNKLGADIYESWLKKISFEEEINNYVLLSVPTRFIRDWITSRYLDQILKIIKDHKKDIIRIEFKIVENNNDNISNNQNTRPLESKENVSFLKDSYLQYNRIDPNKKFGNFITGSSNNLAYQASVKVSENISHYNPLYIYGGVGMGKTHLLNSIGLELKKDNKVMFISAERFMYQFVKSIKSNDMVKFKEYFRICLKLQTKMLFTIIRQCCDFVIFCPSITVLKMRIWRSRVVRRSSFHRCLLNRWRKLFCATYSMV